MENIEIESISRNACNEIFILEDKNLLLSSLPPTTALTVTVPTITPPTQTPHIITQPTTTLPTTTPHATTTLYATTPPTATTTSTIYSTKSLATVSKYPPKFPRSGLLKISEKTLSSINSSRKDVVTMTKYVGPEVSNNEQKLLKINEHVTSRMPLNMVTQQDLVVPVMVSSLDSVDLTEEDGDDHQILTKGQSLDKILNACKRSSQDINEGRKNTRTCGLCHKPGHTRTKCPMKEGIPEFY